MVFWCPGKQNFLAFRAVVFQKPIPKITYMGGLLSLNVEADNMNAVFQGTQFFRAALKKNGLDFVKMRLDMSPPNNITDTRPPPVSKATGPNARRLRRLFKKLPSGFLTF